MYNWWLPRFPVYLWLCLPLFLSTPFPLSPSSVLWRLWCTWSYSCRKDGFCIPVWVKEIRNKPLVGSDEEGRGEGRRGEGKRGEGRRGEMSKCSMDTTMSWDEQNSHCLIPSEYQMHKLYHNLHTHMHEYIVGARHARHTRHARHARTHARTSRTSRTPYIRFTLMDTSWFFCLDGAGVCICYKWSKKGEEKEWKRN